MKTISQLLQLKKNPHYKFNPEELAAIEDFLSKQSGQVVPQEDSSTSSSPTIPAIAHNKNQVHKETGTVPQI